MTLTGGTGTKVGLSDPRVRRGTDRAYRIKATPGITAWLRPSVHSDGVVRDLDESIVASDGNVGVNNSANNGETLLRK